MSSRALIAVVLLCLFAGFASPAGAAASLVADVNRTESLAVVEPAVSGPFLPLGNKVLFEAYEPGSGRELWVSDGTSLGTEILRDICPGRCGSEIRFLGTVRERTAIFAGASLDDRLWRSDGTRPGTFPLLSPAGRAVSICETSPVSTPAFVATADAIYFAGREVGFETCGLWRTDGTREGTRLVKPVERFEKPESLTRAGGKVFFKVGVRLWVSDGTPSGTILLGEWLTSGFAERPRILGALGSRVLFLAPEDGDELWVSDGTPAGTRPITNIAAPEPFQATHSAEVFDGVAYFLVDDVTGGVDLWRSDGIRAGTRRVTAFGFAAPFPGLYLARIGDRLVFVADDGVTGLRWWTSRGTPETTAPIPCAGTCPNLGDLGPFRSSLEFAVLRGQVLFPARDALHGEELWATDGITAPRRVKDLCPQTCDSSPMGFNLAGGFLFFVASGSIWTTDGTSAGTVPLVPQGEVHPILREPPFHVARAGGRFFFAAESEGRPRQLWTSDGTPAGSAPVTVIGIGAGSDPSSFTALGNQLFFLASDDVDAFDSTLWRSDGTPAGTVPVDLGQVAGCDFGERIEGIRAAGRNVFFPCFGSLFRTDGTLPGTVRLTSEGVSNVGGIVPFGTGVAFSASEGDIRSVWTSDGTVAGTRRRFEWPHSFSILKAFGPDLYFASYPSGDSPTQLLATNGTVAGTRVVATLVPFVRALSNLTRIGDTFFFIADGLSGRQIWRTSPGGTGTLPLEAGPEEFPREPRALEALGGTLYALALADGFRSQDLRHMELWRIDGTSGEVSLVRDVAPGDELADRSRLVAAGGRLYFAANDGEHGVELWESDGTEAGTRMVEDVAPGPSSSYPTELTPASDRLYFAADDGVHGREPWVLPLGATACQPSEFVLCLGGGRFKVEADWRDFDGNTGRGRAVSLTADTGYFWFFDAANVEVILKVLDGRGVNGHHWVFYGALSNVRYVLTVTDTQTGAARRYINPPGLLGSVADTQAFGPLGATGSSLTIGPEAVVFAPLVTEGRSAKENGTCAPSATRLCLNGGRFAVEARWRDFDGNQGDGMAVPLGGGDTGYFWFFNRDNVEVVLKVLDGRPVNNRFWVFYGALSNVEYTLSVTDTVTGAKKVYTNPSGRLASVADTGAF
jgi:ELWxxDGT repeat protein